MQVQARRVEEVARARVLSEWLDSATCYHGCVLARPAPAQPPATAMALEQLRAAAARLGTLTSCLPVQVVGRDISWKLEN